MDKNFSIENSAWQSNFVTFCFIAAIGQSSPIHAAVSAADAKVTYSGTNGLYNEVMNYSCNKCHQAFEDPSAAYYMQLPDMSSLALARLQRIRIAVRGGTGGSMPPIAAGVSTLSAAKRLIAGAWDGDGALDYTNPAVDTAATVSAKTKISATLTGYANDNGRSSSYYYEYGPGNYNTATPNGTESNTGTGGNGSVTSKTVTRAISGLSCGTLYWYRMRGRDQSSPSTRLTTGAGSSFTTLACNVSPSITSTAGTSATEDTLYTYTATVTDPDDSNNGSNLTWGLTNAPSGMVVSSTGQVTWVPVNGVTTSGTVTLSVADGGEDGSTADTENFTISVTAVNDAPSITSTAGTSATEDTLYIYTATVIDPDDANNGTDLTWSLTNEPTGMVVSTTGVVTWTPANGVITSGTVTLAVVDDGEDGAMASTENFTIAVTAVNDPPTITTTAGTTATEDILYTYSAAVTDDDDANNGIDLTWGLTNEPAGMVVSSTGLVSWTPLNGVLTSGSVTLSVADDGENGTVADTELFIITVTPINDAPTISGTPATSIAQDVVYSFIPAVFDAEDDVLIFSIVNKPTWASFSTTTGALTGTPTNDDVETTTTGIVITVTDTSNASNSLASFNLSVTNVNDAPTISGTPGTSVAEDSAYSFTPVGADLDGDTLTYSITNKPTWASFSTSTGDLTGVPVNADVGTTSAIVISVKDTSNISASLASFNLMVTNTNDTPTITGSPATSAVEDSPYSFVPVGADVDIGEAATLVYSITNKPSWASFSTSTGALIGTPVNDDVGTTLAIVISVTDINSTSASLVSFNLAVINSNDAPIANADSFIIAEGSSATINISTNDSDVDVGDSLSVTNVSIASNGTVVNNNNGTVTYSHDGSETISDSFTYTINDGTVDSSIATVNVTVTALNDEPLFTALAAITVDELSTLSINAGANLTDDDDANDSSGAINWSLANAPVGMTISNIGVINWTPGENTGTSYTLTVKVADGLEDSSLEQSQILNVTVIILDADTDTIPDYDDNCLNTANTEQEDLDADNIGDICDLDIDGDGIANVAEVANGLDPRDATDALEDLDGDGLTNLEEYQLCAVNNDAQCNNMQVDNNPPIISVVDLIVPATGYVTEVDLGASAVDITDGSITPIADHDGPFRPGRYTINWTATDANNNVATAQQILDVLPLASLSGSVVTDEGQTINIPFILNGDAPDYPVTLNYTVVGAADSTDHDLVAGTVQITLGQEISLPINIFSDQIAEPDEDFIITLATVSANAVLSTELNYTVRISEQNLSPVVALSVTQNNVATSTVYQDLGSVNIIANGADGNGDILTYDWSNSAAEIMATINEDTFSFEPGNNNLLPGVYPIEVSVSDGALQISQSLMIKIAATAPVLSALADSDNDGIDDATEGLGDNDNDGLPDYLDAVDDETLLHTMVSATADNYQNLLQTQRGFSLRIGGLALQANRTGALINAQEVLDSNGQPVTDPDITNFGGISDFEIHGLTLVQPTAVVVLPLNQFVPDEGASYRKFINDSWTEFVVTGDDNVRSAMKVDGICPPPLDDLYQTGIAKFSECIELTLTDGGPNDTDGMVNGVIKDPSGVGVASESNQPPPTPEKPTTSSGGSGQMSAHLLWLLMMLLFIRAKNQRAL